MSYLSPAFHSRSEEEIAFLKEIDKNTGFSLFWIDIIKPLLCHIQARHMLEIGAHRGDHTRLLAKYCDAYDCTLTVIEPTILPSLQEIVDKSEKITLFSTTSNEAIPFVSTPLDAVLLEGDLNYYTVYNDLVNIEQIVKSKQVLFPLVFLRATGWPYARRDMYYDPANMPTDGVNKFSREGMSHWSSGLEVGMINYPFANAQREGGQNNGVLTAAEDFIRKTDISLKLFTLPTHNGVSILYVVGSAADSFIRDYINPGPMFIRFLETVEVARLNSIINELKMMQNQQHLKNGILWRLEQRMHHLIHLIFNRIR